MKDNHSVTTQKFVILRIFAYSRINLSNLYTAGVQIPENFTQIYNQL